jgi:hypothetical protein
MHSDSPASRKRLRRGCFLIHLPTKLYVWRGTDCLSTMLEGGLRCAGQLVFYEGAAPPVVVHQGAPAFRRSQPGTSNFDDDRPAAQHSTAVALGLFKGKPRQQRGAAGARSVVLGSSPLPPPPPPFAPGRAVRTPRAAPIGDSCACV